MVLDIRPNSFTCTVFIIMAWQAFKTKLADQSQLQPHERHGGYATELKRGSVANQT